MLKKKIGVFFLIICILFSSTKADSSAVIVCTVLAAVIVVLCFWKTIKNYFDILRQVILIKNDVKTVEKDVLDVKTSVAQAKEKIEKVDQGVTQVDGKVGKLKEGLEAQKQSIEGKIKETESNIKGELGKKIGLLFTSLQELQEKAKTLADKKDVKGLTELLEAQGQKLDLLDKKISMEFDIFKKGQEVFLNKKFSEIKDGFEQKLQSLENCFGNLRKFAEEKFGQEDLKLQALGLGIEGVVEKVSAACKMVLEKKS